MFKKENYFYIIDDQYFRDFPDPYLRGNHEENRPHYFAFKETDQIFWMIPLSSRVDKYKRIIETRTAQGKPCDTLHILRVAGKEQVFLIQDMFPVTEKYLKREYTINGIPLKIVNEKEIKAIQKKANKIYHLIIHNVRFFSTQPNVLAIRNELMKQIVADELWSVQELAATKENVQNDLKKED